MTVLDLQVSDGADDVRHRFTNELFEPSTPQLAIGNNAGVLESSCRFENVTIPIGSTINDAFLIFTCGFASTGTLATILEAHLDADSVQVTTDELWHEMVRTLASVPWNFSTPWVLDEEQQSPSFPSVVQEIIDLPEWNSGQALQFIWNGSTTVNGNLVFPWAYEGSTTKSAKFHVEFTEPPPPPPITDSEIMRFNLKMSQDLDFSQRINQSLESSLLINQESSFDQRLGKRKNLTLEL